MTNEDQPLDLDDQPFAADLDEPVVGSEVTEPSGGSPSDAAGEVTDWGPGLDQPSLGVRPVADEWARPAGQSSSLLLIMGALVLVMVGVVVFLAINGGNDDDKADPVPAAAPVVPAAPGDPAAAVPPPETVPDPGTDPDLDDPSAVADDFERPGPELGSVPGAAPWNDQVGAVAIEKGSARVSEVDEGSPLVLTTIDAGTADVIVEVRLPSPAERSGLAIRVASPDRFIGLFATGEYGTYTLARFENGSYTEADIFGNTDLTGVAAGDVIGIRAKGSKIDILTNGTVRNSFDDPKLEIDGNGVGLFAFADDNGPNPVDAREFANWDDFKLLATN